MSDLNKQLAVAFNEYADKIGLFGGARDDAAANFWTGAAVVLQFVGMGTAAEEVAKAATISIVSNLKMKKQGGRRMGTMLRPPAVWDPPFQELHPSR